MLSNSNIAVVHLFFSVVVLMCCDLKSYLKCSFKVCVVSKGQTTVYK